MTEVLDWLQFVLAPQMINGLSIGVAVILMALGLTIIFGLLDVINMAHGEFYALGAYLAVAMLASGVPFWWTLVLVPAGMLVVGYATERLLIQRVFDSKDRHTLTLLLTLGLGIVLEDVLKIVFGANPLRIDAPISGATEALGLVFPNYRTFLMLSGGALIFAVWIVVFRTRLGAMVRAAAFDRHMAGSLGVPVARVYAATFAFGVALAGLSGVLLAPIYSVFPHDGSRLRSDGVFGGDRRRYGVNQGRGDRRPAAYPDPVDFQPLHLTCMERSAAVRNYGAGSHVAATGSVWAARPCLRRSDFPWMRHWRRTADSRARCIF
jgi:branched-chain amino acid transport system permease protein